MSCSVRRQLAQAIADELLQRRGQASPRSPGRSWRTSTCCASAPPAVVDAALDDLQRAALEQRVDISSRKNGLPPTRGTSSAQTCGDALAHAEARLDEAHLLLAREAAQLDAHHALEERRDAIVGAGHEQSEDGQRVGRLEQLLRASSRLALVGPLQAVDHDDQRLLERERAEEVADAGDEQLSCGRCASSSSALLLLLAGAQLGQARDHAAPAAAPWPRPPSSAAQR